MYQNLLALHVVDESHQASISVEDIYEVTECLTLPMGKQKQKNKDLTDQQAPLIADLKWPPEEEEFVITLNEQGWNLGSVQAYSETTNELKFSYWQH